MVGLFSGMVRFVWQFSYDEPPCALKHLDKRPAIISKVHYLHFGIILFAITCATAWIVSLLTKAIPDKNVNNSTIDKLKQNNNNKKSKYLTFFQKNLFKMLFCLLKSLVKTFSLYYKQTNIAKTVDLFHYRRSRRARANKRR